MLRISSTVPIFLHGTPVDLRNGFEGLASIAYQAFRDQIPKEAFFVFINRRRTHIKVLYWTKQNLSIFYVRSRKSVFAKDKMVKAIITKREFYMILNGKPPAHLICV